MITLKAYAKINLGLRILDKREDGYHNILTIFQRVNIFDEITLSPSSTIQLTCDQPELPTDESNLCFRAAKLLQQQYNVTEGVHIHLKKNIPIGAGLGGGSSDAATTLIGLTHLWKLNTDKEKFASLALQLGSDVPYFLRPGTAYATGRGEQLEYIGLGQSDWILVVYPNIQIYTAWAYDHWVSSYEHLLLDSSLFSVLLKNDFESLIIKTYPIVGEVKAALREAGAEVALLSGTGSSVFGFFKNKQDAQRASDELGKQYRVFITPPDFRTDFSSPFGRRS